jgi:hypothetical protein
MPKVICHVIKPDHFGIEGMRAILDCCIDSKTVQFEGITDDDGMITDWAPTHTPSEPNEVDTTHFDMMRLSFMTSDLFGDSKTPFATVRSHLDRISSLHTIVLQFGPDNIKYDLKTIVVPVVGGYQDGSPDKEAWISKPQQCYQSSSTPPQTLGRCTTALSKISQQVSPFGDDSISLLSLSRKRKSDSEQDVRKRRRIE